jgi:hypothetical protein
MRIFTLPKKVLAVASLCCIVAIGCTSKQVVAYINLAAQMATNILQIESVVTSGPVSAHDNQLILAFQAVLQKTVSDFTANEAAGNSALISIAEAAQTNIPAFISAAQFDNPILASKVQIAATSFLTIVESIAVIVEPSGAVVPPPVTSVKMKTGEIYQLPARTKIPRKNIVDEWNQAVCQGASAACLVK